MTHFCANCCAKIKKGGGFQCKKCKGVLDAFYCSKKCMQADAWRHKDECYASNYDGVDEMLAKFRKDLGPADNLTVYRCGQEPVDGKPGEFCKGFECYRKLPRKVVNEPVCEKIADRVQCAASPQGRGVKRAATEGYSCIQEYKKRFVPGNNAPARPWTCFGTTTSIMVTWLPPTASNRFAEHTYVLEQREVCDPTADPQTEPGAWEAVKEAHAGTVPSHWVQHLTTGSWYEFRVKTTGPAPEWVDKATWSEPSEPARAGYADYSCVPPTPEGLPASDFSKEEIKFFMTLDTPAKVMDYLDTVCMNHEVAEETFFSALETLRQNCGHCVEGAMLGAYILSLHGHPPLMMDMCAYEDDSHNVIPFKVDGLWGCLSVSNHASLRYRNPIYKTLREMMMSYADDYMNGKGQRSLHAYSNPYHLGVVFGPRWATRRGETWSVGQFGDFMKEYELVPIETLQKGMRNEHLRAADDMMLASTVAQREWRCPDNFDEEAARRNENK